VNLVFHPDFLPDIENSARFYDERAPGLGADFVREVWQTIQKLKSNPDLWPKIYGDVRRIRLHRFPEHSIRYRFLHTSEVIRILGVFHAKRHPRQGKHRR
jgi:toxin ParE1/3/4